ncbi:response regulator [Luteimonas sp. WGS1318]|uniref:response regulator n=1 Tax=Luteimonas sp. WGS1318 TaxID=3366815 RepID=UPI00372D5B32
MTRLLLVEDDPTSRGFLLAAAAALPAHVDVAGSVADARVLATRETYDAWLIDAHLPDGSGVGLLDQLRADGLRTPALAHTAAREPEALDALRAAGFALALSKPVSAGAWQAGIRRVTGADREPTCDMATPPHTEATLVWNTASALRAVGGNAGNAAALRDLFLGELPGTRDAVVRAAGAGESDAVRHAVHRLRAGCGFVGAERMDAAAADLHATPGSPDALNAFLAAVESTLAPR